jgi:uncharacterized protein YjcR
VCDNHIVNIEHTKGGDDMAKVMTPTELASELNVSPKTLRGWLRKHHTRDVNVKNTSWALDAKTCNAARKAFKRA